MKSRDLPGFGWWQEQGKALHSWKQGSAGCSIICTKFSCKPDSELRTGTARINRHSLLSQKLATSLARKSHGSLASYSAVVLTEIPNVYLLGMLKTKMPSLPRWWPHYHGFLIWVAVPCEGAQQVLTERSICHCPSDLALRANSKLKPQQGKEQCLWTAACRVVQQQWKPSLGP